MSLSPIKNPSEEGVSAGYSQPPARLWGSLSQLARMLGIELGTAGRPLDFLPYP